MFVMETRFKVTQIPDSSDVFGTGNETAHLCNEINTVVAMHGVVQQLSSVLLIFKAKSCTAVSRENETMTHEHVTFFEVNFVDIMMDYFGDSNKVIR